MTRLAGAALLALAGFAGAPQAQDPKSAIDWLSKSVGEPDQAETQGQEDERSDAITIKLLENPGIEHVGLLSPEAAGIPVDFWVNSDIETLEALIRRQKAETLPEVVSLLHKILLAELAPPEPAGKTPRLFLARIDKLLELGALEQAQALLELVGTPDPAVFRRWFDVTLLTGHEDRACATMRAQPDLSPTLMARIFCLARGGDWNAAAVTLETSEALGFIDEAEAELLTRFLDPDLFGDEEPLPKIERVTPLNYKIISAIGEPVNHATLPLAFLYQDLSFVYGWKSQLEAAEKLAQTQAIPVNILFGLYTERQPAESGGLWSRVSLVQAFDVALLSRDYEKIGKTMGPAFNAMREVGLGVAFAKHYGPKLQEVEIPPAARAAALRIAALSGTYAPGSGPAPSSALERLLASVAAGDYSSARAASDFQRAVLDGLTLPPARMRLRALLQGGKTGEAALGAMLLVTSAPSMDLDDVQSAIAALRLAGFEGPARALALQLLAGSEDYG